MPEDSTREPLSVIVPLTASLDPLPQFSEMLPEAVSVPLGVSRVAREPVSVIVPRSESDRTRDSDLLPDRVIVPEAESLCDVPENALKLARALAPPTMLFVFWV